VRGVAKVTALMHALIRWCEPHRVGCSRPTGITNRDVTTRGCPSGPRPQYFNSCFNCWINSCFNCWMYPKLPRKARLAMTIKSGLLSDSSVVVEGRNAMITMTQVLSPNAATICCTRGSSLLQRSSGPFSLSPNRCCKYMWLMDPRT
jgi:hypothetical protein